MVKQKDRYSLRRLLAIPLDFFQQYPLLFWGSVWSITLFLIWIALASLTTPATQQSNLGDTVTSNPLARTATHSQTMHFWMFAVIILGCAIGSLLILQRWEQQPSGIKSPKRPKRHFKSSQALAKTGPSKVQLQGVTARRGEVYAPAPGATVLTNERSLRRTATPSPNLRNSVVTVVPTEESHPLDWGETGLAEMMDIRKRRPRPTPMR